MIATRSRRTLVAVFAVTGALASCAGTAAGPPLSSATLAPHMAAPAAVARVDGGDVLAADLETHQVATGLAREEALDDLIDLTLLRAAARANRIGLAPGQLPPDVRVAVELELATKLELPLPRETTSLIVDHAWVKDAAQPKKQAAWRAAMEKLASLCAAGETIPAAFPKLAVDATDWHVGDHEEYPYDVVPAEAHDLPATTLSPIVPGNGGLHLFRIIERKGPPPAPALVRAALHERLRQGKVIEIVP